MPAIDRQSLVTTTKDTKIAQKNLCAVASNRRLIAGMARSYATAVAYAGVRNIGARGRGRPSW